MLFPETPGIKITGVVVKAFTCAAVSVVFFTRTTELVDIGTRYCWFGIVAVLLGYCVCKKVTTAVPIVVIPYTALVVENPTLDPTGK